eukprot:6404724-Pyramimonas_sp.AAC.1
MTQCLHRHLQGGGHDPTREFSDAAVAAGVPLVSAARAAEAGARLSRRPSAQLLCANAQRQAGAGAHAELASRQAAFARFRHLPDAERLRWEGLARARAAARALGRVSAPLPSFDSEAAQAAAAGSSLLGLG